MAKKKRSARGGAPAIYDRFDPVINEFADAIALAATAWRSLLLIEEAEGRANLDQQFDLGETTSALDFALARLRDALDGLEHAVMAQKKPAKKGAKE